MLYQHPSAFPTRGEFPAPSATPHEHGTPTRGQAKLSAAHPARYPRWSSSRSSAECKVMSDKCPMPVAVLPTQAVLGVSVPWSLGVNDHMSESRTSAKKITYQSLLPVPLQRLALSKTPVTPRHDPENPGHLPQSHTSNRLWRFSLRNADIAARRVKNAQNRLGPRPLAHTCRVQGSRGSRTNRCIQNPPRKWGASTIHHPKAPDLRPRFIPPPPIPSRTPMPNHSPSPPCRAHIGWYTTRFYAQRGLRAGRTNRTESTTGAYAWRSGCDLPGWDAGIGPFIAWR